MVRRRRKRRVEPGEHLVHQRDRIDRLRGARGVAGLADRSYGVAHHALVRGCHGEFGGFAHDRADDLADREPLQPVEQVEHAAVAVLLVHDAGEDHGVRRHRPGGEGRGGQHERGERTLRVAGTPAVQPPVADLSRVRVDGHAVDLDGVQMRLQQDRAGIATGHERHHVGPAGQHFLQLGAHTAVGEPVADHFGQSRLAGTGPVPGVDARRPHQRPQQHLHVVHVVRRSRA